MTKYKFYITNKDHKINQIEYTKSNADLVGPWSGDVEIKIGDNINSLNSSIFIKPDVNTFGICDFQDSYNVNIESFLNSTGHKNKYNEIKNNTPEYNFGYLGYLGNL